MGESAIFQRVRSFVKGENAKKGNLELLAQSLGYKATNTIRIWLKKKAIPNHKVEEVKRFFSNRG